MQLGVVSEHTANAGPATADTQRRDSATRVGRSDVIRSLIRQLHADESLYDTVLADLITRR
jgi:hypothetical protein